MAASSLCLFPSRLKTGFYYCCAVCVFAFFKQYICVLAKVLLVMPCTFLKEPDIFESMVRLNSSFNHKIQNVHISVCVFVISLRRLVSFCSKIKPSVMNNVRSMGVGGQSEDRRTQGLSYFFFPTKFLELEAGEKG